MSSCGILGKVWPFQTLYTCFWCQRSGGLLCAGLGLGRGAAEEKPCSVGPGGGVPGSPQAPPSSPNACEQPILNAVNNQFGTNFMPADVGTGQFVPFPYPQVPGGPVSIDVFVPPQDQPDGASPGRYPVNWWTYIVGYGPTLHIPAGSGGLDSPSTLFFSGSEFIAHLDSAFPYNPFGLLIHFLEDVLGIGGHNPCP